MIILFVTYSRTSSRVWKRAVRETEETQAPSHSDSADVWRRRTDDQR
jgi:hypothetical protein